MASEPIPEPLTNQEVEARREPEFRPTRADEENGRGAPSLVSSDIDPARELEAGKISPRLNRVAEAVGSAAATVVNRTREVSGTGRRTADTMKAGVTARIDDARQGAREIAGLVRDTVEEKYEDVKQSVREEVEDLKQSTSRNWDEAALRVRQLANEYPLHVIAATAALGFAAGALLRIWRSSRYE